MLNLVYSTGRAEFGVDLVGAFAGATTDQLRCAVWRIPGGDGRPGGLLIQVSSQVPTPSVDPGTADDLREANERLLLAGLKAQEQAELQVTLRGEAEAALTMRDEFISVAAHELRTPVTGIKTSAQLALRSLEAEVPDKERTVRYLRGIVGGADRIAALMNDLMDASRVRNGELQLRVAPIDLVPLVCSVGHRYAETSGEHHYLNLDVPASPVIVTGDVGRLEQILDNLLSNAIKYSPDGGAIGVCLRQVVDGSLLSVTDSGIGLPPGAKECIFEPFGRADNAKRLALPGLGLGLHICRQIARAHGGRMWAESDGEGQGTTVGMWLPRTAATSLA